MAGSLSLKSLPNQHLLLPSSLRVGGITQIRMNASPQRVGEKIDLPQIRIVRAPRVKLVRGCIDLAYAWPDTPEVGRDFASSNITACNDLINGFLELGRTWFGTVEVGKSSDIRGREVLFSF